MYSRVCRLCCNVAYGNEPFLCSYCTNCVGTSYWTKIEKEIVPHYAVLKQLLWSTLPQYHIVVESDLDGVMDKKGNKPVFDFIIPECRIAVDFISDDQLYFGDSKDDSARMEFDTLKDAGTRSVNYRWIRLPMDPDEARTKLLHAINEIYVKEVDGKAHILTPRLQGDAGWDLVSDEDTVCLPGVGTDIPSQVYLEIPNHLYAIVQARSSTSKKRLLVLPGVIDPAYRGQIFTMTFNPTTEPVMVKKGDRISQLLFFYRIPHLHVNPVHKLRESERGSRGFGSTG